MANVIRFSGRIALLVAIAALVALSSLPVSANHGSQTRFWVGAAVGCGNVWSDTDCWSTSSGGLGGASVPDQHTNVVCDALSGIGAFTIDVTASMHDYTGTACTASAFNPGAQAVSFYGNVTGIEPTWAGPGTGTVTLASQHAVTIGPASVFSWTVLNMVISGAGTKTLDGPILIAATGTFVVSTSVTVNVNTVAGQSGIFSDGGMVINVSPGSLLTLRSKTPGTPWVLDPLTGRITAVRTDIRDANVPSGKVFMTDVSNTNSGGNDAADMVFSPRSSILEETAGFFTTASMDYSAVSARNRAGHIVAIYPDGTSVNNGDVYARYSTNNASTWSSRIHLHGTPDGIVDDAVGMGWEISVTVDSLDTLYLVGHKLSGGATHILFSKIDIETVSDVATFSNWKSASGAAPSSIGAGTNGAGFDLLSVNAGFTNVLDPSVTVALNGDVLVGYGDSDVGEGAHFARIRSGVATHFTVTIGGGTVGTIVRVLADRDNTLHFLTNPTIGGQFSVVHLQCPSSSVCTTPANWLAADGIAAFDYVISSALGDFNFAHPTVDADNNVHVVAGSNFQVAGFFRVFHNYLLDGATTWANGNAEDAAGTEINSLGVYPARTRLSGSDPSRLAIAAHPDGDVYILWGDQQTTIAGYQIWNGATWGNHVGTIAANKVPVATWLSRSGDMDWLVSESQFPGIHFQTSPNATTTVPWWNPAPPVDPRCFATSVFGEITFLLLPVIIGASILLILFAAFAAKHGGIGLGEGRGVGPVIILIVSVVVALVIVASLFGVLSSSTTC